MRGDEPVTVDSRGQGTVLSILEGLEWLAKIHEFEEMVGACNEWNGEARQLFFSAAAKAFRNARK
jgi:hypothetical protein